MSFRGLALEYGPSLTDLKRPEKYDANEGDHDHGSEAERGVELGAGLKLQVAEAALGGDVLADHRADHREADADLQSAKNAGERRRQTDLEEGLPFVGTHGTDQIDHGLVQPLQADDGRDDDREESKEQGQKAFRGEAVTEIQDQERCERHLRYRL